MSRPTWMNVLEVLLFMHSMIFLKIPLDLTVIITCVGLLSSEGITRWRWWAMGNVVVASHTSHGQVLHYILWQLAACGLVACVVRCLWFVVGMITQLLGGITQSVSTATITTCDDKHGTLGERCPCISPCSMLHSQWITIVDRAHSITLSISENYTCPGQFFSRKKNSKRTILP